jgi:cystathionine beta-lyase family protein involved in aluminum resistance
MIKWVTREALIAYQVSIQTVTPAESLFLCYGFSVITTTDKVIYSGSKLTSVAVSELLQMTCC